MRRLKKRAEFLAAARGARAGRRAFSLQATSSHNDCGEARFGFTVTKKTGNSPERNRIRRRLREAVRLAGGKANTRDYVLVGRREALALSFADMIADLKGALAQIERKSADPRTPAAPSRPR